MVTHSGGCHCGRVRFEVEAPAELEVSECNCSMCSRTGYLHLIVPKTRFRLVSGRERCVLLVHPEDAARAGVRDGDTALMTSRVHRGPVPVRLSGEMRPGVVSLPHGWGHAAAARTMRVAGSRPGVSFNDWSDDAITEPVVGQSILNGVPVQLTPLGSASLRAAASGG